MKKVIVFDLDGTLAPSKSPLPDKIGELLGILLEQFQICVISGGKFEQFEKQLLSSLHTEPKFFKNLHIMPTCGTRYYKFDLAKQGWQKIYAEDFTESQKRKIITVLSETLEELGFRDDKTYGEIIEDRGSQITLSTLGQDIVDELGDEGVRLKEAWDPYNQKKNRIRERAAPRLEEFEVRVGGLTSIDVTKPGIDKAYGMEKLMKTLSVEKKDILFIGDRLGEGGNDYPVKAMGIDSIEVSQWQDTAKILQAVIYISR